ncbi:MAG: PD-(D/E)XK nuclease family protein, partial [Desulfuromonadales bacterium]|nr:PD-(D/E)XK nuclease family protein [Desulfuromonadales bacterium]
SALGKDDAREIVFSGWEAETARHIGTVAHACLERIARDGIDQWPTTRLAELELPARSRLGQLGVAADRMPAALEKVVRGVRHALTGSKSRWLFGPRAEAGCEFELSGLFDGKVIHAVIDRTFVDADGCRWVVDYKLSEPRAGQGNDPFLAAEAERYHPQLAAYAELFGRLEPHRPVRAGLYFPLLDGWIEISVDKRNPLS